MSAGLQATTHDKLAQFCRRRRRLYSWRGLAVVAFVGIAVVLVAVAIDAAWRLPPEGRWALAATCYIAVAGAALVGLIPLLRRFTFRQAAQAIEALVPEVRQRLLSAVELADQREDYRLGSPAFREQLQKLVSRQIEPVSVAKLLPWKLVRRWLALGLLALVTLIGLFQVPQLRLTERLMRVLLPAANIARPTWAKIAIVRPNPASTVVPLHEIVQFEVAIAPPFGRPVRAAVIELRPRRAMGAATTTLPESTVNGSPAQKNTAQELVLEASPSTATPPAAAPIGASLNYTANWTIAEASVDYRVVTDVGESAWHHLEARPRPTITSFHKRIDHPPYAQVAPTEWREDHGDVSAIIGSRVTLSLATNVAVERAELQWRPVTTAAPADGSDGGMVLVPCERSGTGGWTVTLPIETSGAYQVRLTAADSGLVNTHSPTYQVTAVADQPPQLRWLAPSARQIVSRATAAHDLRVDLRDEYPVDQTRQSVRVNHGEWRELDQHPDPAAAPDLTWTFRLWTMSLRRGDLLETRLAAWDRHGQEGASPVLEIVISDAELLKHDQPPGTSPREAIARRLHELAQDAIERQAATREARELWQADQGNPEKSAQVQRQWRADAAPLARQAAAIRQSIQAAAKQADNPVTLDELERSADALAKLEHELAAEVAALTDDDPRNDPAAFADDQAKVKRTGDVMDQLTNLAKSLDDRFRKFVAHDVLADLARDLQAAKDYHQDVNRHSEAIGSAAWQQRETLLGQHLQRLAVKMEQHAAQLPDGVANQLRQWSQWSAQLADNVRQLVELEDRESEAAQTQMRQQVDRLGVELASRQHFQSVHGNMWHESLEGRRELQRTNGLAADVVTRAADNLAKKEAAAKASGDPAQHAVDQAAVAALEQLAERRETQLSRSDAPGQFAADLGDAYRAAQAILRQAAPATADAAGPVEALRRVGQALKKLEALREVERAEGMLERLLHTERWAANGPDARVESPRVWDALAEQFGAVSQQIRGAGLPATAADVVDQARYSAAAGQAAQKIGMRRWSPQDSASAAAELESLRNQLATAKSQLHAGVAEARELLREMAPSVPQLARAAAAAANEAEAKTQRLAEAHAAGEVPNLPQRLQADQPQRDAAQATVEQLQDALTDLAATQNPLAGDERTVARDADASRNLAQHAQQRIDRAAEAAAQAQPHQADANLKALTAAQQQAARAFDAIAQHFDNLDDLNASPASMAASRQRLHEAADATSEPQVSAPYELAERLERVANADPRSVLQRLERELAANPRMREALSEIAADLARQSKEALEYAAQRERSLRAALEESDPAFVLQKKQMQQELGYLADQASRVAQRLGNETQANAASAGQPQRQQQLRDLAQALNTAVAATRPVNGQSSIPEMQAAAQQLAQGLQAARPQLRDAAQGLAAAASEKKFDQDDQRLKAKQQLEKSQNQYRDQDVRWADANVKFREQRQQELERLVKSLDQQLQQARQQRDRAQAAADKDPASEAARRQHQETEARVAEGEAVKQLAENQRQQAEAIAAQAREERERAKPDPPTLDAQNPQAELASRLTTGAANRTDELASQAEQLAGPQPWQQQWQAGQQPLTSGTTDQTAIQESVAEAARNLDRAAAHEQRLQQPANATALQSLAQRVGATANNEARAATRQLSDAAQSESANSPAHRATPATSAAARQSVEHAEQAIRQRAAELQEQLAQLELADPPPVADAPPPAEHSSWPLDAAELARLLDELDRQLRTPAGQTPAPPNAAPPSVEATAAMQNAQQDLAAQLNQARQQGGAENQAQPGERARQTSESTGLVSTATATPGDRSGQPIVIDVEELHGEPIGAWSRLREQAAADVVESQRESVSPRYRRQVEGYFRALSEKSLEGRR